ncbi:hypothetical protein LTS18_000561, partial [Coniosporium uncinatum]
ILAWNGGGSSNYTDIVKKGGYTVANIKEEESFSITIPKIDIHLPEGEDFEHMLESAKHSTVSASKQLKHKFEQISEKIEGVVADELKSFMKELEDNE